MGAINVKHTGSGAAIALSSDGTSLLLDGTAIGGGGGDPALYRDNAVSATTPTASGDNAVAIGSGAVASGLQAFAVGSLGTANASGQHSISMGSYSRASGSTSVGIGHSAEATTTGAVAIGQNSRCSGTYSVSLGKARASGSKSFAAVIDNNTSTYGATNTSSVAIGVNAKASGQNSFALGNSTVASGSYSVAHGYQGQAIGSGSFCTGDSSIAEGGASAVIGGRYGHAKEYGKVAFGGGNYLNDGNTINLGFQAGILSVAGTTTDATTRTLTSYDNTASTTNQLILPNNSAFTFTGTIIAREKASAGSDYASWEIKGALLRDANAASTVLGSGIQNKLYATSGASAWAIALTADTTNGGLKIEVTGAAATNIRWATSLHSTEVIFA